MAGRRRSRLGLPKPPCRDCTTIPAHGWSYCCFHHDAAVRQIADAWETNPSSDGFGLAIRIPDPGKPLWLLDREERAALGLLIARLAEAGNERAA